MNIQKAQKTFGKIAKIRFYIGLFLVGILFTVIGGIIAFQPKKTSPTAEAEIVEIYEETVFVTYTDSNGDLHEHVQYGAYSSSMKEGDKVVVQYNFDTADEMVYQAGTDFIVYVVLLLGVVCVIVSIWLIIRDKKQAEQEKNEDAEMLEKCDEETIERLRNSTEPTEEYYFHFTKNLNQSFILETTDRTPVFEANCEKISLFKPTPYEFVNYKTGEKKKMDISHTVTKSYGAANFSVPTSSSFKINGTDCWKYLKNNGYTLEYHLDGLKMCFNVLRYGIKVAEFITAGANVLKDKSAGKLGEIPTLGIYRVSCREEDLEGVFFACFIASRVEFF